MVRCYRCSYIVLHIRYAKCETLNPNQRREVRAITHLYGRCLQDGQEYTERCFGPVGAVWPQSMSTGGYSNRAKYVDDIGWKCIAMTNVQTKRHAMLCYAVIYILAALQCLACTANIEPHQLRVADQLLVSDVMGTCYIMFIEIIVRLHSAWILETAYCRIVLLANIRKVSPDIVCLFLSSAFFCRLPTVLRGLNWLGFSCTIFSLESWSPMWTFV